MATMVSGLGGPAGYGENVFSSEFSSLPSGLISGNLDDGSILVDVTSVFGAGGIDYFGTNYTGIYIKTNGLITFASAETAYSPVGIDSYHSPAIAPFWSDVDINKGGEIYWDLDPTAGTFTVTWHDVAPYSGSGTNSFQMILTDIGGGNFSVEFIYEDIQWTDGYAGDATVGFTDGGANDTVLPGSGDPTALTDYDTTDFGNGDPDGTWELDVMGGSTLPSNGTVDGTAGDDIIDAGAENDTVYGDSGNDTIDGGTGADTLDGGIGNDTINVAEGDVATGGDGDDTFNVVDFAEAGASVITITGGENGESTGGTLYFGSLITPGSLTYTGAESGSATLLDGTTVNFSEIENVIVCFTQGTRISTPYGQRDIKTLEVGDLVLTMDHGPSAGSANGPCPAVGKLAPIRIKSGTFDNTRDLIVSPQHRMLCDGWKAQLIFGEDEVFAATKHLINDSTIVRDTVDEVTYIHIMFDEHEVVFSENAPSENFFPGHTGLDAVGCEAREELFTLFPEIRSMPNSFGPTARQCLRRHEAGLLMAA